MERKLHFELSLREVVDIRTALDYWSEELEKQDKPRAEEIKELALYFDSRFLDCGRR